MYYLFWLWLQRVIAIVLWLNFAELDVRKLVLEEVPKRRVAHQLYARLQDLPVLQIRVVQILPRDVPGQVHGLLGIGGSAVADIGLEVLLEEVGSMPVDVERERVVGLLAVVAVDARRNTVRHHMLPYPLELVVGAVLEVEERVEADAPTLVDVLRPQSLSLLVADRFVRVCEARHRHAHQIHVMLRLRQLGNVEPVLVHRFRVEATEAALVLTLTATAKSGNT